MSIPTLVLLAAALSTGCTSDAPPMTTSEACTPVPPHRLERGTQGYKTWHSDELRAFAHEGTPVCVTDGWEPVGASETGPGWARFPNVQTAVLIASDAWKHETFHWEHTSFPVRVIWPQTLSEDEASRQLKMIAKAYADVSPLYPPRNENQVNLHTVLVTAGLAGSTKDYESRIYPEPGPELSIVVRRPSNTRGAELFIHAVSHLYNRHRIHWPSDEPDLGVPTKDWQELVATWTETAFLESDKGRKRRLAYVYRVHTAVRTNDFSLITGPPFDDPEKFETIVQGVAMNKKASNITLQYGHYILAPVSMVGLEGLLAEAEAEQGVGKLLEALHEGRYPSWQATLESVLSPSDVRRYFRWIEGKETVPEKLVLQGRSRYDQSEH